VLRLIQTEASECRRWACSTIAF